MMKNILTTFRRDFGMPVFISLFIFSVVIAGLELLRPGYFTFDWPWGALCVALALLGLFVIDQPQYKVIRILLAVIFLLLGVGIMFLSMDFQSVYDILIGVVIVFVLPISIYSIR